MKREFLTALGLEQDVINQIMAEHGTDIEKLKTDLSIQQGVVSDLKAKLGTAQTDLSKFEGVNIEQLTNERDTAIANYKQALKDKDLAVEAVKRDSSLDSYLSGYKFSSDFARNGIKALIAEKNLKFSDNKFEGIDDVMKELSETHADAFVQSNNNSNPSFTAPISGGAGTATNNTGDISYLAQAVAGSPWLK